MTTAAKTSFGAALKLAVSPGAVATVAELFSIEPGQRTRATIDVTSHDSSDDAMEFIAEGVWDAGEITVQGHYVAGSTFDDLALAAVASGSLMNYELIAKAASGTETETGTCYVTAYGPDGFEVQGKQTFSATLKKSGAPTQAATV